MFKIILGGLWVAIGAMALLSSICWLPFIWFKIPMDAMAVVMTVGACLFCSFLAGGFYAYDELNSRSIVKQPFNK